MRAYLDSSEGLRASTGAYDIQWEPIICTSKRAYVNVNRNEGLLTSTGAHVLEKGSSYNVNSNEGLHPSYVFQRGLLYVNSYKGPRISTATGAYVLGLD